MNALRQIADGMRLQEPADPHAPYIGWMASGGEQVAVPNFFVNGNAALSLRWDTEPRA